MRQLWACTLWGSWRSFCTPSPAQAAQAERIRSDVEAFGARVAAARSSLKSRPYLAWATGPAAAYPALDAAATEISKLRKECERFAELARMFDLAGVWGRDSGKRGCTPQHSACVATQAGNACKRKWQHGAKQQQPTALGSPHPCRRCGTHL